VTRLTVSFGVYGKIPARGDFVRSGLPGAFVDAWDAWLQRVMAESQALLAQAWLPAWMEAPVWHFHLAAGTCGPSAAAGILMPSIDRAGRHFPLTLACVGTVSPSPGWLATAEAAGIAAVTEDIGPEALMERLPAPDMAEQEWQVPAGTCAWRTEGSPKVLPSAFATGGLPDSARFALMLRSDPACA